MIKVYCLHCNKDMTDEVKEDFLESVQQIHTDSKEEAPTELRFICAECQAKKCCMIECKSCGAMTALDKSQKEMITDQIGSMSQTFKDHNGNERTMTAQELNDDIYIIMAENCPNCSEKTAEQVTEDETMAIASLVFRKDLTHIFK